MRFYIIALLLAFLLILGCVGLKTEGDCEKPGLRDSEKITCLHQLAISEAYRATRSHIDSASAYCARIWTDVGEEHIQSDGRKDDVAVKAESERSLCYYDIAKIIARHTEVQTPSGTQDLSSLAGAQCDNIQQGDYSTELAGAVVTREMCDREVERLSKIRPENYFRNTNNICSVVFVLPAILAFAFLKRN